MHQFFRRLAKSVSCALGSPYAFAIAVSTKRLLGPSHGLQTGRSVPAQGMTVGLHRSRLRHQRWHV